MIDLQVLIERYDLVEYQEQLHRIARIMIRIQAERSSDDDIPVGASKMGGDPDVPVAFDWPVCDERPMAFLMQLNLADVAGFRTSQFATSEGMLYFFHDTEPDYELEGTSRVVNLTTSRSQLQRTRNPATNKDEPCIDEDHCDGIPVGKSYYPCSLAFSEELSLPDFHSPTVWGDVFGKSQAFVDDYWTYLRQIDPHWHSLDTGQAAPPKEFTAGQVADFSAYSTLRDKYFTLHDEWLEKGKLTWELDPHDASLYDHHMFGYCQPVQSEPELLPGEQLLLQLDTHTAPGWMWGDMGKLYFWILEGDLAKNDFSHVQLDVQMG